MQRLLANSICRNWYPSSFRLLHSGDAVLCEAPGPGDSAGDAGSPAANADEQKPGRPKKRAQDIQAHLTQLSVT